MTLRAAAAVLITWAVVAVGTTSEAGRDAFSYTQYVDSTGGGLILHSPKRRSSNYQDIYRPDQSLYNEGPKAGDSERRLLPDNINAIEKEEESYFKRSKNHNKDSHRKHSKNRLHHSSSYDNHDQSNRRQSTREDDVLNQDYNDMLQFERQMQPSEHHKQHHHHNHRDSSSTHTNHHKHHKHQSANHKQTRKQGSRIWPTSTVIGTEYTFTHRPKNLPSKAHNISWHVQSDSRRVKVDPEPTPSPAELSKITAAAAAAARVNNIQRMKPVDRDDDVLSLEAAPEFDNTVTASVMAQLASHAYLPCRIIHLGDKSVSWVRNNDSHILTVDRYTFISDDRFTARFEASSQTWTLQIKFVSDLDAGSYECQVSTEPKMSRSIQLRIVHPIVTIPGGTELHVRSGSDVDIKCVIAHALQPPPYVFWYHEGSQMNVEGGAVQRVSADTALAVLTIRGARRNHAGNYTCSPAGLLSASVTLHVLNGEHPAAMQHGTSNTPSSGVTQPLRPAFGGGLILLPLFIPILLLLTDRGSPSLSMSSFAHR